MSPNGTSSAAGLRPASRLVSISRPGRRRMLSCWRLAIQSFLLAFCLLAPLPAQERPRHLNGLPPAQLEVAPATVQNLLTQADQLVANAQPAEALEIVRRLISRHATELVAVGDAGRPGFIRYQPLGRICQQWIASLGQRHPAALANYRSEVDALAAHWYEQALSQRDEARLRQVVEQFPNSTIGQQAMLALGDSRLEAGDIVAARASWQQLNRFLRAPGSELATGPVGISLFHALEGSDLSQGASTAAIVESPFSARQVYSYPGSTIAPSKVMARLVLASILSGEIRRARWELELLKQLYPDQQGTIAGRQGRYSELLASWLAEASNWSSLVSGPWTSFSGAADRSSPLNTPIDIRVRPSWTRPLAPQQAGSELLGRGRHRVAEAQQQLLSYHPVSWQGRVFVHDGVRIRAFQLSDGQPAWSATDGVIYTIPGGDPIGSEEPLEEVGVPRFTSTVDDGRLYARMGAPWTAVAREDDLLTMPESLVVGLDLAAEGRLLPGFPLRPPGSRWAFEGTPVSDGESIYLVLRHSDQVRCQFFIACYAAGSGLQRWRQPVLSANTAGAGDYRECSHQLLTLANGRLYYNSNSGAIACLETTAGRLQWITSYPRASLEIGNPRQTPRHFFRDLVPCLLCGSAVVCAPADGGLIFALDAASGRLIWQTEPAVGEDVTSLLGVIDDQLVCSGDHLYWLDVYNGKLLQRFPQPGGEGVDQPRPEPAGWGRGVLTAGRVYWPLADAIMVFERLPASQGWQLQRRIDLASRWAAGGNLAVSEDRLLIAGPDRLYGFHNDR